MTDKQQPLEALEQTMARQIVKKISDAALDLAFMRHDLTSDEFNETNYPDVGGSRRREQAFEQFIEEIQEDVLGCLTGDDSGCNDPEELDASNCELIWLTERLACVNLVDDARVKQIRWRAEIDGYRKLTLRDGNTSLALVQARADVMELLSLLPQLSSSESEEIEWLNQRIAELERRLKISFGKLPCALCGGPHDFDTSVPSVIWNSVIRAKGLPDYLCTTCIVREFAREGQSFTAELWNEEFNGVPIEVVVNGQNAKDAAAIQEENNSLRNQISSSERRCGECGHDNGTYFTGLCATQGCGHKCVFPATGAQVDYAPSSTREVNRLLDAIEQSIRGLSSPLGPMETATRIKLAAEYGLTYVIALRERLLQDGFATTGAGEGGQQPHKCRPCGYHNSVCCVCRTVLSAATIPVAEGAVSVETPQKCIHCDLSLIPGGPDVWCKCTCHKRAGSVTPVRQQGKWQRVLLRNG